MSLASYLAGSDHSLTKAALNAADCIQVTVILLSILAGQKGKKIHFPRSERLSLWISGVAIAAWMVTKTGWIGFVGFQVVMSVAYLPTLESLWRWKPGYHLSRWTNGESTSLSPWWAFWLISQADMTFWQWSTHFEP